MRVRELPRWLPALLLALVLAAVAAGWVVARQSDDTLAANSALTGEVVVAEGQRDATADQALDLAVLIKDACDTGTIPPQYLAACQRAEVVRADPIPPAPGRDGRRGPAGLTPPCYYEPDMCRGRDSTVPGPRGDEGPAGPPGPPGCDAGTARDQSGACVPTPEPESTP